MRLFDNSLVKRALENKEKPRECLEDDVIKPISSTKNWKTSLKDGLSNIASSAWKIVKDTPIEIALIAGLGLSGGIFYGVRHENMREKQIPLAFSEHRQIEKENEERGNLVGPITHFYALDNDMRMKIFEAWNKSWKVVSKDQKKEFGKQLGEIMDYNNKRFYYNLSDLLERIPIVADEALVKLKPFNMVLPEIRQLDIHLDAAWSDSHYDHYHTEYYTDTETYTDSDGKRHSRTVTKSRSVYDYTDHSYTFNSQQGNAAGRGLSNLSAKMPRMEWPEMLLSASKTNPDGERAIKESRAPKKKGEDYSEKELREIARKWNVGCAYNVNHSTILGSYSSLMAETSALNASLQTAHSTSYRTYSHFDSGPSEFQINESALSNGRSLEKSMGEVLDGLYGTRSDVSKLINLIPQYVEATSTSSLEKNGRSASDISKLQKEILTTAREGYKRSFPQGLDVKGFRGWYVALMAFSGLVAGGLIGL